MLIGQWLYLLSFFKHPKPRVVIPFTKLFFPLSMGLYSVMSHGSPIFCFDKSKFSKPSWSPPDLLFPLYRITPYLWVGFVWGSSLKYYWINLFISRYRFSQTLWCLELLNWRNISYSRYSYIITCPCYVSWWLAVCSNWCWHRLIVGWVWPDIGIVKIYLLWFGHCSHLSCHSWLSLSTLPFYTPWMEWQCNKMYRKIVAVFH